ncbi:MAG: hypothetical protein JHC33_13980 [Ignisphaera sp.]|nr:hypothetical protein [Ignisphaera sp.]
MRPQVISLTGTGTSAWIPMDYKQSPFNVGLGAVDNGTITYDIEHTFDEVFDPTVTPTAFKHSTMTAKTTNFDGNYAFPIRAIRINNTAGTGSTTLTILQGLR